MNDRIDKQEPHTPTHSHAHALLPRLLPFLLIILAGVLAYWNSFDGVFVYDDLDSIRDNLHIRKLWPLKESLSLPLLSSATTVDGRPLLSLSLALNHSLFGPEPWGYHLVNLLIHLAAGLLLFGVVRRTLHLPQFRERYARSACPSEPWRSRGRWLALATALIWLVHPLQTESVTYIVQRAESLMGMLFLLTMYCAIRGFTSGESREEDGSHGAQEHAKVPAERNYSENFVVNHSDSNYSVNFAENYFGLVYGKVYGIVRRCSLRQSSRCSCRSGTKNPSLWYVAAIIACAIGMGVKQTMFSVPLLVLLYDALFISDSFRAALTKRWRLYAALCSTWLIIFGIMALSWQESTIDFVKISPLRYALTQPLVILYYLRLVFWPSPLVLEYGWALEDQWHRIVFPALAILGMLAAMFRGIVRRKWYGFVAAWFFLILAPTSSIAPTRQAIFEHRMYLSLAAVVMLVVVGGEAALRKLVTERKRRVVLGGCMVTAIMIVLGCLTHNRNTDYHSEIGIWQDDVAHRPGNALAHLNLGNAVQGVGRPRDAVAHYREALRLKPDYAEAHYNWGVALEAAGQTQEAMVHYQQALQLKPDYAEAHNNMAHALEASGRPREAVEHCRKALQIRPGLPDVHFNLGNALQALGRSGEAIQHYREALRLRPDYAEAHLGWGNVLLVSGRLEEAVGQYREALRLKPDYAEAHYHWGMALDAARRPQESMTHYQQAVRIKPTMAAAHLNLGNAVLALGRPREAIPHYRQALRIRPDYVHARDNLRQVQAMLREGRGTNIEH
ncbi:MAG: tetratricopeptide repeat protein [Verrucomicrobia bacterium]|jgi:protein O-mannosyl-transferase|nr:tetratricopeptide repeat protein [Verrucomicrobiota bacterium]MBT7068231.1 tetratricopeptide repeat protein [Verrucomicrobiota bacterium]MBT7699633.1 tetratricopeptide repeat protein [Verrucomicrobiota bacterium]